MFWYKYVLPSSAQIDSLQGYIYIYILYIYNVLLVSLSLHASNVILFTF